RASPDRGDARRGQRGLLQRLVQQRLRRTARVGDLPRRPAHSVDRLPLPDDRVARGPGHRRALDGRLRRDDLRRAPSGHVRGRGDPIEAYVHQASLDLHERLTQLGIPHVWDDYGPGGHQWPYWQRDLRETLPSIMAAFAHPPPPPSPFTFAAVEPSYEIYGWHV